MKEACHALRVTAAQQRAQDVTEDRKRRARGERLGRKNDTLERDLPEFDDEGNLVHADRVGGEEPEDE